MTTPRGAYRPKLATGREHGKRSTYQHGCNCLSCRAAAALYIQQRRTKRAAALALDPALAPHGTVSTYRNWGCRCTECKAAHAAAQKALRYGIKPGSGSSAQGMEHR
jgi:hypothetical protein